MLGPIKVYVYADVYVYAYGCFCIRFYIKDHYNQPEIIREALTVSIHSRFEIGCCTGKKVWGRRYVNGEYFL